MVRGSCCILIAAEAKLSSSLSIIDKSVSFVIRSICCYTHLNEAQMEKMHEKVDALFQKQSCTKVAQEEGARQIEK